jgi:glutamyl-tRNA synthetase
VTVVHDVVRGEVEFPNATIEDFVIQRSDGRTMFILANAVDDLDMAVTHIIRGEDHLSNTPKAILVWEALGAGYRPTLAHVPLLVNEQRQKLSKRRDKLALESFREEGYLPHALRNFLCLLGWSPRGGREFLTLDEMIAEFRLEDVNNSPAFFDVKKLTAFNQHYLMAMDDRSYIEACQPFLERGPWKPEDFDGPAFFRLAPLVRERARTLAEVATWVDFVFVPLPVIDPGAWEKAVVKVPQAPAILRDAETAYATSAWEATTLHHVTESIGRAHGLVLSKAQAPIRVAVTGRTVGLPLFESLEVLGRERTLERIRAARARLEGV